MTLQVRQILSVLGQPVVVHRDARVLDCSPEAAVLFGHPSVEAFVRGGSLTRHRPQVADPHQGVHAWSREDGRPILLETRTTVLTWEDGAPALFCAFTLRTAGGEPDMSVETILRQTLDGFSDAIMITDPMNRVLFANASFHRLHPDFPPRDQVTGQDYGDVLHAMAVRLARAMPDGLIDIDASVADQMAAHTSVVDTVTDAFSVGVRHYARRRERVNNGGIITVIVDVTARRQVEDALAERESLLRQAARIARWGYYVWDSDLDVMVDVAPELADLLGRPRDGLLDSVRGPDRFACLVDPRDQAAYRSALATFDGELFDHVMRVIRPDGEVCWVHEVAQFHWGQGGLGHQALLIGVVQDVSEHREAEGRLRVARDQAQDALDELRATQAQLVQAEKLAALGGLVAGVAHEINTPLGIALTAASHLADEVPELQAAFDGDRLAIEDLRHFLVTTRQALRLILGNCERAATLVQSFKHVSADHAGGERRVFDLKDYVEEVLIALGPRLKPTGHRILLDLPDGVRLDSYPGAFWQILSNLLLNCVTHAFAPDQRGTITIAATLSGGRLDLSVADDGCGIPERLHSRVFEPFFTTNRVAGGTGLGLHIVFNLVTGPLGGRIATDTKPGERGTRMRISIPMTVAPAADPGATPASNARVA